MQINQKSSIAIEITTFLARNKQDSKITTHKYIVEKFAKKYNAEGVEIILQLLANSNILHKESETVTLNNSAKEIYIISILDAVEEKIKLTHCADCKASNAIPEGQEKCDTHYLWKKLGAIINDQLSKTTIADLLMGANL